VVVALADEPQTHPPMGEARGCSGLDHRL